MAPAVRGLTFFSLGIVALCASRSWHGKCINKLQEARAGEAGMITVSDFRSRQSTEDVDERGGNGKRAMGKVHTKMRLDDVLLDSEFIETSSQSEDMRKKFRAVRKRQVREAELRIRREHAMRKKLGIK
jgi:hypothetical protein